MTIREIEEKYSHPIGILGDLQGPKLRVSVINTANSEFAIAVSTCANSLQTILHAQSLDILEQDR